MQTGGMKTDIVTSNIQNYAEQILRIGTPHIFTGQLLALLGMQLLFFLHLLKKKSSKNPVTQEETALRVFYVVNRNAIGESNLADI